MREVIQVHFEKILLAALFLVLLGTTVVFAFYLPHPDGYKEFVLTAAAGVLGALIQALRGGTRRTENGTKP